MKTINTKDLTDDQYLDLEAIIENSLAIFDQLDQQVEYGVVDLMIDSDGKIFAPTKAMTHEETTTGADYPTGGHYETTTVLQDFEPIYNLIKR